MVLFSHELTLSQDGLLLLLDHFAIFAIIGLWNGGDRARFLVTGCGCHTRRLILQRSLLLGDFTCLNGASWLLDVLAETALSDSVSQRTTDNTTISSRLVEVRLCQGRVSIGVAPATV